jgi:2-iminobutanoate/2-iminopropanoate deaminase
MEFVQTLDAPVPAGHYSQAVVHNGLIFVSGQLPIDPAEPEAPAGSIADQTEQTLANLTRILKAANSGLNRLLKVTIYISDIGLWGEVNAVYSRILGDHRPARAVVPTRDLHHDFKIEIEAIAAVNP